MKSMTRFAAVITFLSLLTSFTIQPVWAGPAVTTVGGKISRGQIMTISGTGFGQKYPAKPYIWADFESGFQPSPLGLVTSWSAVENMERAAEGFNGTYGARGTYVNAALRNSVSWTLRVDYDAWTRPGQKFYLYRRQKANFAITDRSQNWKTWRMWPNGPGGYPNVYSASSNGRIYVEGPNNGFWSNPNEALRTPANTWFVEEILGKASSGIDMADGSLKFRINGLDICGGNTMMYRSTAYPSVMKSQYAFHGVAANINQWTPAWNGGNRMWVDDIYLDTTWARVMIGDQATLTSCRQLEVQIPTSWTDSSVRVYVNPGSFTWGSRAYVFVWDKDGNVNPVGYPVTIGTSYGVVVASGDPIAVPTEPGLAQKKSSNVFNPARNEAVDLFQLDKTADVDVSVYDRLGRRVRSIRGAHGAGFVRWDGRNDDGSMVASGLYIVEKKLDGGPRSSQKVVVLK